MKHLTKLLVVLVLVISTSSCWDFSRRQEFLDAENTGKARLIQSESEKKVLIEDAKARNEAATLEAEARIKIATAEAEAEIERARGVAKANEIIGESLKGNREYLEYLKIQAVKESNPGDKIYIPTEAMLPITEAKK